MRRRRRRRKWRRRGRRRTEKVEREEEEEERAATMQIRKKEAGELTEPTETPSPVKRRKVKTEKATVEAPKK